MMNTESYPYVVSPIKSFPGELTSDLEPQQSVSEINERLEAAGSRCWGEGPAGRHAALRLLRRFNKTAMVLESCGWPADRIRDCLAPSRRIFATSPFMRRCQEWPRGYPGDFETIEYLADGINHSLLGTLGWHIEEILLQSSVVEQHRNKLLYQSLEIGRALKRSNTARVLSIACGGCLDWMPLLTRLSDFAGEIVLNDCDSAALELAERRIQSASIRYCLAPGNIIRVAKHLMGGPRFDLVIAGGLCDYLSDRAIVYLVRAVSQGLLALGGKFLFTNMAAGNPWRPLMEYGSNWKLIERSECRILEICREAGIPQRSISIGRESTGLTLITAVSMMG
jgi:hypothetical protein